MGWIILLLLLPLILRIAAWAFPFIMYCFAAYFFYLVFNFLSMFA